MSDDPVTPDDDGDRDERGRFTKGNRAGRGNGAYLHMQRMRAAIDQAIGPDAIAAVLRAMVDASQKGDAAAARVLLDHVLGKPRVRDPEVSVRLGELSTAQDFARAFGTLAVAAATGDVPADTAASIAAVLRSGFDASSVHEVLAQLEARLAEVEQAL